MAINKAILIGNLGNDPDLRRTDKKKAFCSFSVATNRSYTDQNAQRIDQTDWHQIVCFGDIAENCARFLKKGRQVYVEGRIQSQHWQDKEGISRVSNRVVANLVQFLGTKPAIEPEQSAVTEVELSEEFRDELLDDFPF